MANQYRIHEEHSDEKINKENKYPGGILHAHIDIYIYYIYIHIYIPIYIQ